MKYNLQYQNKSKDELISELIDLTQKYNSLKEKYESTIEQQNNFLNRLNNFSIELANISPEVNLEVTISRMIKELTGARGTVFSEYVPEQKTLTVQHIELEKGLLDKVIQLIGIKNKKINTRVTDEIYQLITAEPIGIRQTLTEMSFGSISKPVSNAIQALLKVNRFIALVYIIEGKLYGTSMLAFGKDQPDPSVKLLESIRVLAALTLRRRKAENALREIQSKNEALLETIPDIMFIQDKSGTYLDFFSHKDSHLYAKPEAFIGKNMSEVLPPQIISDFKLVFERALQTKIIQNYEYTLTIDGKELYFESRTIVFQEDKLLSLIRDITERKLAEKQIKIQNEELKKLNEDKNRFISILAHDLRSPFTSILGFLDLLSENFHKYDSAKIKKLIGIVQNSSRHFYQLLESLLIWGRSQSGKISFTPQEQNLNAICTQTIEELNLNILSKHMEVNISIPHDITVYAHVDLLKTILRNLISNAVKFSYAGGKIDIYTEPNDELITVVVADTGIGMPEEVINTLFSFSTRSAEGTQGETGSGLGLFLCKELVEMNKGKIWVESEPEKGSKFKFTLPIKRQ